MHLLSVFMCVLSGKEFLIVIFSRFRSPAEKAIARAVAQTAKLELTVAGQSEIGCSNALACLCAHVWSNAREN